MPVDQNSNYFRRLKPSLQSVESVNTLTGADHQQQQVGQPGLLRRSEHDMYGSKLSTRMQDTAKSAWKASRKFASSVITGSVGGISACRQCTKKRSSGASLTSSGNVAFATCAPNQQLHPQQQAAVCVSADNGEHLTSVVEVGKAVGEMNLQAQIHAQQQQQQPVFVQPGLSQQQQQPSSQSVGPVTSHTGDNLIRVDENNKLTIVTKFNDSDCHMSSSSSSGASNHSDHLHSASSSERSRCESSSSGRGTASDAGSSGASQNGDSDGQEMSKSPVESDIARAAHPASPTCSQDDPQRRQHKRKSSLFKASKVFGGSQASLNKLRSFFAVASAKSAGGASDKAAPLQHPQHPSNSFFAQVVNQSLPSDLSCELPDASHKRNANDADVAKSTISADKATGCGGQDNDKQNMTSQTSSEASDHVGQGEAKKTLAGEQQSEQKQDEAAAGHQQVPTIQIQVKSSPQICLES